MSKELEKQRDYWNRELAQFDAIYSRRKSQFGRWLDRTFRKDMFERYEYALKNAEPIKDHDFLDVGCGTGHYALEFVRRGCRHVTGIDISEEMVEYCRHEAAEQGMADKTEYLRTDLLDYTPSCMFHVCIGIGLFDYISDPLPVLKKMRQCISDSAILSFPRLWTWRAPIRKARLNLRGCFVRFYSQKRIAALLREAGFANYNLEKVGKLFCVTAKVK
jgi:2-polyprenyl-3-methyl-5-hydroxy-6-metoxy-1,4-benzoquinol methylase